MLSRPEGAFSGDFSLLLVGPRNRRVFEGKENALQSIIVNMKGFLHYWAKAHKEGEGLFFQDMVFRWERAVLQAE